MDKIVSLEVFRHLKALRKIGPKLTKTLLYEYLFEEHKLPEDVAVEVLKGAVRSHVLFTELYISLPYGVPVVELAVPFQGRLLTFQGMGVKGALISGLHWLLHNHQGLIAAAR